MADIVTQHNIGALIAAVTSVLPQSASAAVNGASIDRFAHGNAKSCLLHQAVGADTGAPTAISVVTKLQHSPDDSTWADYEPDGVNVAETAALTAVDTETALAVDLGSANRWIRAVSTPTLTGGTTPAIEIMADVILGGQSPLPAV